MIFFSMFLLAAIVSQDPATTELSPDPRVRCGIDCLYLACNQLEIDVPSYKDFLDQFVVSDKGSTLEMLQTEANILGLGSLAIFLETKQLKRVLEHSGFPIVVICHLERGHYVLAYRSGVDEFSVVDTSAKLRVADAKLDWPDKFSGNCLLLASQPLNITQVQSWAEMGPTLSPLSLALWAACSIAAFNFGRRMRTTLPKDGDVFRLKSKRTNATSLLVILSLVGLSEGCNDGGAIAPGNVLEAEVGSRSTFDLGSLYYEADHSDPSFQVILKNASDRPIPIGIITSSCGCSSAKILAESIQPKSEIPLIVHMSRGLAGERELVFVVEHGKEYPETSIRVKGSFFDSCRVEPSFVRLGAVSEAAESQVAFAYFHVTSPSETAPELKLDTNGSDTVEVSDIELRSTQCIDGRVSDYRHVFRTKVSVSPKVLEGTSGDGTALIAYTVGKAKKRTLNVSWSLERFVVFAPSRLVFESRVQEQKVVLSSRNNHRFEISKAEVEVGGTEFAVQHDRSEKTEQSIVVRCADEDQSLPKTGESVLVIETNMPEMKSVQVPVSWSF